jgi:hypothetical protein
VRNVGYDIHLMNFQRPAFLLNILKSIIQRSFGIRIRRIRRDEQCLESIFVYVLPNKILILTLQLRYLINN